MNMKLIKLSSDHYIIVDDSEIKEGDNVINIERLHIYPTPIGADDVEYRNQRRDIFKKITHSTQPLEPYTYDEVGEEIYGHMYDNIQRLSLSEVKELLGEVDVDVEKKADEFCDRYFTEKGKLISVAYKSGYNQALEDNKDRKYTEEDMKKAIEFGHTSYTPFADVHYSNFIQSLQPPTSWDVQFVDGKLKLLQ